MRPALVVARPFLLLLGALLSSCIIVQPPPPEEDARYAPAPAPVTSQRPPPAPAPKPQTVYAPPPAPPARRGFTPPPAPVAQRGFTPPPAPVAAPRAPAPSGPRAPGTFVLSCEGFEVEERYLQQQCEGFPSVPRQAVSGLESVPEPLRSCLLTGIPMPPPGATRVDCQYDAQHRLQYRLYALGWIDAEVQSVKIPGAGTAWNGPPWLHVSKLGARYQIGDLFMDYFSGIELKREDVIAEARKAIPPGAPWAALSTMEAMRQRVSQMGAFEQVTVAQMNKNPQTQRLPLKIVVHFVPSLAGRAKGCPEVDQHCFIGAAACKTDPKTGCLSNCHCEGTSFFHW